MPASPMRSGSVRNPAFSLGVLLGVCFSGVGLAWLLVANRVPHLDQFASDRNLALAIAFVLLGLVPACRFMKSPGRSFLSGITAWTILTAMYFVAELGFPEACDTPQRFSPLRSRLHGLWPLCRVVLGDESRDHASPRAAPADR